MTATTDRPGAAPPSTAGARPDGLGQPLLAGLIGALVGFVSSAAVVLAGLRAVGADGSEAASGLLALSVVMGVLSLVLALRTRVPISVAWSTPGAALLVTAGASHGGYPAAIGAFVIAGVLLAATGLSAGLARRVAAIPAPLASAMLAGILLPICFAPVRAIADLPGQAVPVVAVWALLTLVARRLAVPGAIVAMVVVVAASGRLQLGPIDTLLPTLTLTAPRFDLGAIVGIGLPLFLVTMASQNLPGIGVLASFGYRTSLRPPLVATGIGTILAAPLGGHAVNLAALSAALVAGPDAGPRERRWIAAATGGAAYVLLGLLAGLVVAFVAAAPPLLVETVAGLALLGALEGALGGALADVDSRPAAVATLVIGASGVTVAGVGGAFWGLLVGLTVHAVGSRRARSAAAAPLSRRARSRGRPG